MYTTSTSCSSEGGGTRARRRSVSSRCAWVTGTEGSHRARVELFIAPEGLSIHLLREMRLDEGFGLVPRARGDCRDVMLDVRDVTAADKKR